MTVSAPTSRSHDPRSPRMSSHHDPRSTSSGISYRASGASQTIKDVVAGSGLSFEPREEHDTEGVPDRWRIYRSVS